MHPNTDENTETCTHGRQCERETLLSTFLSGVQITQVNGVRVPYTQGQVWYPVPMYRTAHGSGRRRTAVHVICILSCPYYR
jgi:hypothetical protein